MKDLNDGDEYPGLTWLGTTVTYATEEGFWKIYYPGYELE